MPSLALEEVDYLLSSKLDMPPLRANAVPRPRLTRRLSQGCQGALTLLSAPAGYGKTTLLAEWHALRARERLATGYVSLDAGDNDPLGFMAYLAAALARLVPGLVSKPPVKRRRFRWRQWLIAVLNQVAALDTPLVLVLDANDDIQSGTVQAAMTFLVEHQPEQLHLVIAARADPPMPIARLRALGRLTEIRAAELAFDEREAAAFLARMAGLELDARDVARLQALTEGWPAGLQLAALALRDHPGGHRYVYDYLVDQVLSRQPEDVQRFMLETSLLDRLNGPLCDALTGRANSAWLLSELERAGLFLARLDGRRKPVSRPGAARNSQPSDGTGMGMQHTALVAYRYHPLMLGCLQERLRQRATTGEMRRLHTLASQWHEQNGQPPEAIRHALAAADFERAALLIDRAAEPAMARGDVETIVGWLQSLPDAIVRARPGLCVWHAWVLCLTGHWQGIEPLLQAAETQLHERLARADGRAPYCRSKLGEIAAIRALAARLQGDLAQSIYQSQLARASLQDADFVVRSVVAQNLGTTYVRAGKYEEGRRALAEAECSSLSAGHSYIYVGTLIQRARLCELQRQLPEAVAIYRLAREHSEAGGLASLSARVQAELEGMLCAHQVLLDPLSPRELEVLRLIAAGRSTPEVAAELGISAGTVRNHLKNIYGKLGAHTRLQVVEQARALNVL